MPSKIYISEVLINKPSNIIWLRWSKVDSYIGQTQSINVLHRVDAFISLKTVSMRIDSLVRNQQVRVYSRLDSFLSKKTISSSVDSYISNKVYKLSWVSAYVSLVPKKKTYALQIHIKKRVMISSSVDILTNRFIKTYEVVSELKKIFAHSAVNSIIGRYIVGSNIDSMLS